ISWQITCAIAPSIFEAEILRHSRKDFRRIIKFIRDFKGVRVVGQTGRVFDEVNLVSETLKSDDIMNVLPDDTGDRHRAHEAHDDDALAFHEEENVQRSTFNVKLTTSNDLN